MILARFRVGGADHFGLVEGNSINVIEGSIFNPEFILTNQNYNLNQVRLLHPSLPSKVIAVGLNYKDHTRELKMNLPKEPLQAV